MQEHVIFSTEDLPKRRIGVRQVISNRMNENIGLQMQLTREKMFRMLSAQLAGDEQFVQMTATPDFVTLDIDCIVLTQDELRALMQAQFKAGIQHAQGFLPSRYMPSKEE